MKMRVPHNLRQLISAESAANDGLGYAFLTFAIYLMVDKTAGEEVNDERRPVLEDHEVL